MSDKATKRRKLVNRVTRAANEFVREDRKTQELLERAGILSTRYFFRRDVVSSLTTQYFGRR